MPRFTTFNCHNYRSEKVRHEIRSQDKEEQCTRRQEARVLKLSNSTSVTSQTGLASSPPVSPGHCSVSPACPSLILNKAGKPSPQSPLPALAILRQLEYTCLKYPFTLLPPSRRANLSPKDWPSLRPILKAPLKLQLSTSSQLPILLPCTTF